MAHSHFVMDLYYREVRDPDLFRRDVLRIEAKDDREAEAEGRRIGAWRKPAFFAVRAIQTAKNHARVIFDTRTEGDALPDETSDAAVAAAAS